MFSRNSGSHSYDMLVLWTNRNNKVWRNKGWSAGHILHIAGKMMNQWQEAHHLKAMHNGNPQLPDPYPTTWKKPMVGWYKMNVDAAVDPNKSLTGCGSIFDSCHSRLS